MVTRPPLRWHTHLASHLLFWSHRHEGAEANMKRKGTMPMSKMRVGVVAAALVAAASVAQAAPITLNLVAAGSTLIGPQSDSAPCIIAGTHCQNPAGFGYTNFVQSGNDPDYN